MRNSCTEYFGCWFCDARVGRLTSMGPDSDDQESDNSHIKVASYINLVIERPTTVGGGDVGSRSIRVFNVYCLRTETQ